MHYCCKWHPAGLKESYKSLNTCSLSPFHALVFSIPLTTIIYPLCTLMYFVHLPHPQCKLCEARDFSSVYYCIPGSQKELCIVVQQMCWMSDSLPFFPSRLDVRWLALLYFISDAQLSLIEKSTRPVFSFQLLLVWLWALLADDLHLTSAH